MTAKTCAACRIERKRRLAKLVGKAKRRSIQFVEHLPVFSSTRSAWR
jgi:hypothetical protein